MWPFLTDGKNHYIAIVGGGGKTTLLYELAAHFAAQGLRTAVTTTTHILRPAVGYAENKEAMYKLWEKGNYAVLGLPTADGKLTRLAFRDRCLVYLAADILLVESDGARGLPCKVPAAHEPVLPERCESVIGVFGLDAVGRKLSEVCQRWQLWPQLEAATADLTEARLAATLMTPERAALLLTQQAGTRKNVNKRDYYLLLNKCDDAARLATARQIVDCLEQRGISRELVRIRGKASKEGGTNCG